MVAGDLERASDAFKAMRVSSASSVRVSDELRPKNISEGYDLQDVLSAKLEQTKGVCCGHKIGCTTPVMQAFLNIPHPCAGRLYANEVYQLNVELALSDFVGIGIECEIALSLGQDIIPGTAPHTATSVASSVVAAMAAAEIVDNRYTDFHDFGTPSLIADDFFSSGAVFGPAIDFENLDLAVARGSTFIDGVEVASGLGDAVMGNPLNALAWLANHKSKRGEPLLAGDVIMTGSVVETQWIDKPCVVECRVVPLGVVMLRFI